MFLKQYRILIYIFLLWFFLTESYGQTYKPPIGIPIPDFGIEETVESVYGPGFYTHYIDNTHRGATDINNPNGSQDKPRKTIPQNMTLPAGSVVLIKGGPYQTDLKNIWTCSGTADKPVFIRGIYPDNRPQLLNFHLSVDGQYFIIEDIEFYDDSFIRSRDTAAYFAIRNCEIHNPPGKIINFGAAISARGSDVVIYKNHIHHNITNDPRKGGDCHGVNPGVGAKRVWILDNHIHHNSGDAVQACHACDPAPQYVYIGRNLLHEDRENGVDLKYVKDVVISQNILYGYKRASTSDGSAMVLGSDGMPNRPWVIFNEIYDSDNGIRNEETDNAWIIGNKIYNIKGFAIALEKKSDDLYIIGNTVCNVDVIIHQYKRENFRIHVFNNIFANIRGKRYKCHLNIPSPTIADVSEFANNLFWQDGAPVILRWDSEFTIHSTLEFENFPGGANNIIGNPLFRNVAKNNFELQKNSAAIDKAIEYPVYEKYYRMHGLDIKLDYNGTVRPQHTNWDIGAYEYIK
ncbi:right-handed parallel beta-helix repeat-containing protein [candidate division KSB1 bacterium]|nr:right-handed parallel beta-helix repeat-containing protein [candidate division KSB1 bacterium]